MIYPDTRLSTGGHSIAGHSIEGPARQLPGERLNILTTITQVNAGLRALDDTRTETTTAPAH